MTETARSRSPIDIIRQACMPAGAATLAEIETPAVVVDLDVLAANIRRFQDYCDHHGLNFRPHIKTHKIRAIAAAQLAAGAVGINCQKISEAEVMADGGANDLLITYNLLGPKKLARTRALAARCTLAVTADSDEVVDGLSAVMADAARPLSVLVECDTGAGRCGVQSPEAAQSLATRIAKAEGLAFRGLMTYPAAGQNLVADAWLGRAKALCEAAGLPCPTVTSGGSPDMWAAGELRNITEYRAGTYVYNDRSLVARGTCTLGDCALSVLATVVSRPTETRAIVDSGSKSLTTDLLGQKGFGTIRELPGAAIHGLNEEHGLIDLSEAQGRPAIGDKLRIVPNHVCVVSNLVEQVYVVSGTSVVGTLAVAARGCSV